jgi:Fic family protein
MPMDRGRYRAPAWGRVVSTGGPHAYDTFVPAAIPRTLDLSLDTVCALSEADAALGRLAGAGRLLPDPHILVLPYVRREALASARIEGTQATLSDVLAAAAGAPHEASDDAVREVTNYVAALEHGLARLGTLPLSLRLLRECHGLLLADVRGAEKTPGEFRRSQNWIGSPDNRPETAMYVPPHVDHMMSALDDWERFIHDPEPRLPLLLRAALLHYQFETIHPFLDGNGRLGRLVVTLYLVQQGRLPAPLLYLSAYLENNREEYYEHLQGVRERGEVEEWLRFFLAGVAEQATDAVSRTETLVDLRERLRGRVSGMRSRAPELVDMLFDFPILSVGLVVERLGITPQGVRKLLRSVAATGTLREVAVGRGTRTQWYADEVLEALLA